MKSWKRYIAKAASKTSSSTSREKTHPRNPRQHAHKRPHGCLERKTGAPLIGIRLLGCLRLNDGKAISNNALIAVIDQNAWQPHAEINDNRWIKRRRILKGLQANEELEGGKLLDLLNQLFIGEPQSGLDDHCTKRHLKWLSWCAESPAEL